MTVTVPPQIRARGGIRSTVEQEREEEFGDGPLPRDRGVAALGHRDVRVPGDLQRCGGMVPGVLAGEQLDPGPAGAGSCFRLGLAVRSRLLPEYTTDDHPGLDGRTILITGTTSGIGYAATVALARRGAAVHFLARDHGGLSGPGAASPWRPAAPASATAWPIWRTSMRSAPAPATSAPPMTGSSAHPQRWRHPPRVPPDTAGTELTIVEQVVAPFLLTRLLRPALVAPPIPGDHCLLRRDVRPAPRPPTLQLPASRYRGVTVYARARWPGRARHRGWFTGAVVAAGIACCRGHVVAGFGRYWARPGFCET